MSYFSSIKTNEELYSETEKKEISWERDHLYID
jgi:hypothetical protein